MALDQRLTEPPRVTLRAVDDYLILSGVAGTRSRYKPRRNGLVERFLRDRTFRAMPPH